MMPQSRYACGEQGGDVDTSQLQRGQSWLKSLAEPLRLQLDGSATCGHSWAATPETAQERGRRWLSSLPGSMQDQQHLMAVADHRRSSPPSSLVPPPADHVGRKSVDHTWTSDMLLDEQLSDLFDLIETVEGFDAST